MKLVDAPGSPEMRDTIRHPIVRIIVDIMLSQIKNRAFFESVALFLKTFEERTAPNFTKKLDELGNHGQARPNADGYFISPPFVSELVTRLEELYAQPQIKIRYQRGAIVELIAFNLVKPRWQNGECLGNQAFVYERNPHFTDQIDVAVLSRRKRQIEAYTCKLTAQGIKSEDCTNLISLAREAVDQGYEIHTGAVSFDNSRVVERILASFPDTQAIKSYGINNMRELENDPFF